MRRMVMANLKGLRARAEDSLLFKMLAIVVRVGKIDQRLTVYKAFDGGISGNPRAIFEEVRRRSLDRKNVWVVQPEVARTALEELGDVQLVHTRTWKYLRVLAKAALVVVDGDIGRAYKKKRGVTVVQTWHGTPLKRIGFDIATGVRNQKGMRQHLASLEREVPMWDFLLSQNSYSSAVLSGAFRYHGRVLELGYPRNDVLNSSHVGEIRKGVRRRLRAREDEVLVLYAPTLRDDDDGDDSALGSLGDLGVARLAANLGAPCRVLVRLHPERARRYDGADVPEGVVNVSHWPDINELYLASEILVTDYSSVMFDFAITGKPIVLYVPDLEHYRDEVRGFYFDLVGEAPGPVVTSADDLVDAVRDVLDGRGQGVGEAYEQFRGKFCALDDGSAGARVVDCVFGSEVCNAGG